MFGDLYLGNTFKKPAEPNDFSPYGDLNTVYLYTKDGKRYNDTPIYFHTIYNGKLYIIKDGKPLVFNKEKNTFEPTDTDYIKHRSFAPNVYVHKNGKFGVIMGDFKSPVIYDDIVYYYKWDNSFLVKQGDKYGVIGPHTNIPCVYTSISSRKSGYYQVSKKSDKEMAFRYYTETASNFYKITSRENNSISSRDPYPETFTLVDSTGKELIPPQYTNIYVFDKYIYATNNDMTGHGYKTTGKRLYHIYDKQGNLVKTLSKGMKRVNNNLMSETRELYKYDGGHHCKVMDMNTLKTYDSIKDFIIAQNPNNQLLKDCDITIDDYGFEIRYHKK